MTRRKSPLAKLIMIWAPLIFVICLIFLLRIPIRNDSIGMFLPHVSLIFGYYYILNKPGFVPPLALFSVGFIDDFASGTPFGVTSFILLMLALVLNNQQKITQGQGFLLTWIGFVVIAVTLYPLIWLLHSFAAGSFLSIYPLLLQGLVTIMLFPIITMLFRLFNNYFLK